MSGHEPTHTPRHDDALVLSALTECFERWGKVGTQTVAEWLEWDFFTVQSTLRSLAADGLVDAERARDLPTVWIPRASEQPLPEPGDAS